ncbi:MAG: hypothetical protein IH862_11030, partial [Chloroflexi bacterium]|nr:hypothetical protein [Chloroflexota bacterium]
MQQAQVSGVCGDLTGDGLVNVFDAITLLQVIVALIEPTADQQVLGDLNGDTFLNVFDAITLLQIIVGLVTVDECGPINQPPVFDPVGPLTVMPGGHLQVLLTAIDPEGDPVQFSIGSDGLLPSGSLEDDTLVFTPVPGEEGSYNFTLTASDGVLGTTQSVTLEVVTDAVTTTRLSAVIQNTAEEPLIGVPVELGPLQTITAADGSFTLESSGSLPGDTLLIRGETIAGTEVYPFIAEKVELLLGHTPFEGINNVIGRPIFLPALDMDSAQPIDPAVNTTVSVVLQEGEEPVSVSVAAGTLEDQDGNLYTGLLSITEVPRDLTPAALPEDLLPDTVVTIQPGEMVFTTPAPITFPNRAGFPAGRDMELWSISPVTGVFEQVGTMRVSTDGSVIETISGGIRNSSWHSPAPPPPPEPLDPTEDDFNPDECQACGGQASGSASSEIQFYSGALIETHELVLYRSLGVSRGLTLRYSSLTADPRPIVHVGMDNVPFLGPDGRMVAILGIDLGGFIVGSGSRFWRLPQAGSFRGALMPFGSIDRSGRYPYQLTVGFGQIWTSCSLGSPGFPGGCFTQFSGRFSQTVRGTLISVSAGWALAGWQELVENTDGSVLLIDGDGTTVVFSNPHDNVFDSPPGDFSTLSKLPGGTFSRTLKDQTVFLFNSENKLALVQDRNGNETHYEYDTAGRLVKIVDPVGLETIFTYTEIPVVGDRVTSITDPAGRTTQLEHDDRGNLIRITDPDGSARTFEYDNRHHLTAEVDKLGNREEAFYDPVSGRATGALRKDGSFVSVDPVATRGLHRLQSGLAGLVDAPFAVDLGEPTASYADANGNITTTTLDS